MSPVTSIIPEHIRNFRHMLFQPL